MRLGEGIKVTERIKLPGLFVRIFRPAKARKQMRRIEELKAPHIYTMPAKGVLVAQLKGHPGEVAGRAFRALFSARFKIKGIGRKITESPRARFPREVFGMSKKLWNSVFSAYALPVPNSVRELPAKLRTVKGLKVTVEDWEYGEVAEILHVGPYSTEPGTIQKLEDYIRTQGYKIIEEHEEEYHAGPGMLRKGNPANYTTLIRYRIQKKGVSKR
jgi:hypothetical protein